MKRVIRGICGLMAFIMLFGMLPVVALGTAQAHVSLTPASTQQRRMWCTQSYSSGDYVYEPDWLVAAWGRVHYVRFMAEDLEVSNIHSAVIHLEGRARSNEKDIYVAALALSDTSAKIVESDLTSLTSTNKVTTKTSTNDKLMTDKNGYYLDAVASSVVAYGKFTAEDEADSEVTFTSSHDNVTYEYPIDIRLDVTDVLRTAKAQGDNVQLVLMTPKDVMLTDGTNLGDLADFEKYENGTVYDADGDVMISDATARLDTSIPVCGGADYYTPEDKTDDDYFSWVYMLRGSISLEIDIKTPQQAFAEFKGQVSDADALADKLGQISHLLDEDAWDNYQKIQHQSDIHAQLYTALQECTTYSDFADAFVQTTENCYWQGYALALLVDSKLGGWKGTIGVEGTKVPAVSFAKVTAFDEQGEQLTATVSAVKAGVGYYNVYGQKDAATLRVALYADQACTTQLAVARTLTLEDVSLPEVFITEISNRHTSTYYTDYATGTYAQNKGQTEQTFQYIELHNYSDKTVDLGNYTFVYTDQTEHEFSLLAESAGDYFMNPGDTVVIGVYSADSATKGYTYDSSAGMSAYWKGFNTFYNADIAVSDRLMIACVESGDSTTTINGIDRLKRSADAGVTVSAEMRKDGATVTKAILSESKPNTGYAFQFVPGTAGKTEQEFLFVSGCFPGSLLDEQDLSYCEQVFLNGTPKLGVMSYNILAIEKNHKDNRSGLWLEERAGLLRRALQDYQPDIVGFQEVNHRWVVHLPTDMAALGYACVQGISGSNHTYSNLSTSTDWDLMNPIYYKADKFEMLEGGGARLNRTGITGGDQWDDDYTRWGYTKWYDDQWDSGNMNRTVTWAVLKDKQTGEVTIALNTHLVLSGKAARVYQVTLIAQKGAALQAKYGGKIVVTGDHNMQENSEPYQAYINSGVLVDSKYQTINHNSIGTCPNYEKFDENYAVPIDFCFVSPEYAVGKYEVFNGAYAEGTVSDHSAVYVELFNRDYEDTDVPTITGVEPGKKYCVSATFSVREQYPDTVMLDGKELGSFTNVTVNTVGEHTLYVKDVCGREVSLTFTVQNHSYGNWYFDPAPSCGQGGKNHGTCSNCTKVYSYNVSATGLHTEGALVVDRPPTCNRAGVGHKDCTVCHQVAKSNIEILKDPNAHKWETAYTVDRPANCVQTGKKSIHCEYCDAQKAGSVIDIPINGQHTPGTWTTVTQPTLLKEGLQKKFCTTCGIECESQKLPVVKGEDVLKVFSDVTAKHWFYKNGSLNYAYNAGLLKGVSDGKIAPNAPVERGMFVTILGRLHGVTVNNKVSTPFTDVKSGKYYTGYVKWASDNGIVNGLTDTTFGPGQKVTREQICAMMLRYCDYADIELREVNAPITFADAGDISKFAKKAIAACQTGGIVNGSKKNGKNVFLPKGNATRAEVATILMNFVKEYK